MSVEFNEPPALVRRLEPRPGGLISLVLRTKIVSTQGQAKLVLLIIVILLLTASFAVFRNASIEPPLPTSYDVIPR